MFIEESLYFAEWNYLYIVIQVYMVCTGNNQQFLLSSTYKCNFLGADNKQ